MKTFLLVFLAFTISQSDGANGFCGGRRLHADLTRAVVRSSDWLRQYYQDNTTTIAPHQACSMMVPLRLSGHQPDTLINDFKNGRSMTIRETVVNYLDDEMTKHGNLTKVPVGRLALIIMGVLAICENPNNFYGYDLYRPLRLGIISFNNHFEYSLVVIALCNGRVRVPNAMVNELVRFANGRHPYVDTNALALVALSCVKRSFWVRLASIKLARKILSKQNRSTGAFGNQYSTALAAEALDAAGVNTRIWRCEKVMRNILSYQNEQGLFGSLLANVQVTPSLLGESLIDLKNLVCPVNMKISVVVQLSINDTKNPERNVAPLIISVPKGTTAFVILELAGQRNPCYKAEYKVFPSGGRFITSICSIEQDPAAGLYWLIYENGALAKFGVDQLKPKQGTRLTFRFEKT